MKTIHPLALFRLSVLGPLASRERLGHGELKRLIGQLSSQTYLTPTGQSKRIADKTIEHWFYLYKHGGIEALAPKPRSDHGQSKLPVEVQQAIVQAKRDNPKRSLNTLIRLFEMQGVVAKGELSRSSVHRLLQQQGLSKPWDGTDDPVERRRFVAEFAGDLWQGDVMHGPTVSVDGRRRKVFLVSLMDDASRLMAHSAFCLGETALHIEGVLKQALLKRGLPKKLLIDNGPAYRSNSLQAICARLEIRLVYCKPYQPEGKGKLEKWHRTARDQFLSELDPAQIRGLDDLNARLWAWLDQIYHVRPHSSLNGLTPLERYQRDLLRIRPLGPLATHLDDLFYHRHRRTVRRDGTVTFNGRIYEVPFELARRTVVLVVDPHADRALAVESKQGEALGPVTPLDAQANMHRRRRRPEPADPEPGAAPINTVELALKQQVGRLDLKKEDR
jgi:putative transposase